MARTSYTAEQRAEALALYAEHGLAEAARRTGIKAGTIGSWAHRSGTPSVASEKTAAAVERASLDMAARRLRLAEALMGDIERLRRSLWQPCTERKALVVSGGMREPGVVEIVDIDRDQPSFGEQKTIMTALAIAVDKVQLLTGEATERHEHRHSDALDEELQRLAADLASAS